MIHAFILEDNDVIKAEDLVREVYLRRQYTQSDMVDDAEVLWKRASDYIPAWVGKCLGGLQEGRVRYLVLRPDTVPETMPIGKHKFGGTM